MVLLLRPVSAALLAVAAVMLAWPLVARMTRRAAPAPIDPE